MSVTSYRTFVDGLEGLTIEGIERQYEEGPPASLNTADMPAQWVQIPAGDESGLVFGASGYEVTLRAELVVAVEAYNQDTPMANFDATVDIMDAIVAALRSSTVHNLATGSPSWSVRLAVIAISSNLYWAVIAPVEVLA